MALKFLICMFLCSQALYNNNFVSALSCGSGQSSLQRGDGDPLQVLCIVSSGSGRDENTQAALPGIMMAIEHVNMDSCHSLNITSLNITVEHSECDRRQVLDILHSNLFDDTPEVAIIGAGCSLSSEAVAEVSQYYNLSMISFQSLSMSLDDRERFPYFFRTVPSLSYVSVGITEVIFRYEWKRVVLITQDRRDFRLLSQDIGNRLEERNVTIMGDILLPNAISAITRTSLFPPDVRIIILNMNSDFARYVICEAINTLNWEEHSYVWLTQGWYEDQWWNTSSGFNSDLNSPEVNCTGDEILKFLRQQRVLGIDHYPIATNKTTTTRSGILQLLEENEANAIPRVALFAYDAVWALFEALSKVDADIHSFDPFNISHENRLIGEAIRDSIRNVSFTGATGDVNLRDGSRIVDELQILQYRHQQVSSSPEPVALVRFQFQNESAYLDVLQDLWPGNVTPSDGSPYYKRRYPYLWLVISSNVLVVITIMAAVFCIIFTFIFRNRKLIRLSSPNLNYLIGVGVIVFSVAVFFFSYPPLLDDSIINIYCGIRSWFAAIGYSLCFGTINTKMWRVYYIFHNPKPTAKKKPLKDIHLFLFVMVFILVDVIILVICTALDGVRLEIEILNDREHPSQPDVNGITVNFQASSCESRRKSLWLGVLFGYKVIVQGIGVFLAFKIRKVKIKVLNDSREVVITLYITSAVLAIVIIITLFFDEYQNVYAGGYSYGITLSCIIVLTVVFFSKMVRLYKDPAGDKLFTHITQNTGASAILTTIDGNQIQALQRKIKQLEAQITSHERNGMESGNMTVMAHSVIATDIPSSSFKPPREANCKHVQIILND